MRLFGPPEVQRLEAKGNIKGLSRALKFQHSVDVRIEAAAALGRIGDHRAVWPLIDALEDGDERESIHAIKALVKIGEPAVEPLIAAVKSASDSRHAIRTLGEIGD